MAGIRTSARHTPGPHPIWRRTPDHDHNHDQAVPTRPIGPDQIALLRQGDPVTRARVAGQLQRQAGNRFVQDLISRDATPAPAVLTDEQQWAKDWNDYPNQRRYFNNPDRPTGTPRERYDALCPLYKAHGIPRPMVYLATSVTTAKFFDFRTPAHANLATALAAAEKTLSGKGFTSDRFTSVWALNARTTSEGTWSDHADGKAVDIDPDDNPRLNKAGPRRIIGLVTKTDMEKSNAGYDVMKTASDRFKADYNAAGLARRTTELKAAETVKQTERDTGKAQHAVLKGQQTTLTADIAALKKQLRAVPKGKKATPTDVAKAAELNTSIQQSDANLKQVVTEIKQKAADVKKLEAALKKATQDRTTLEQHLAAYRATDQAIADLETSVGSLPTEIKAIEDQITKAKAAEDAAKSANDKKGVQAQRNLQKTLKQALSKKQAALKKDKTRLIKKKKARDEDPLRQMASRGFLNLPKEVVEAMTAAGLKWGGNWGGNQDFMHFQL